MERRPEEMAELQVRAQQSLEQPELLEPHAQLQEMRQIYALMDVLEREQEEDKGESVGVEQFFEALRPLLEAEAHLASVIDKIERGGSGLYDDDRRPSSIGYKIAKY